MARYRIPARALHWLIALALPIQIHLGWAAEREPQREAGFQLIHRHFQLGVLVAALMVLRLIWRLAFGTPAPPAGASPWRRRMAAFVHGTLYATLFLLPVSGYVIWIWMKAPTDLFGLFDTPRLFTPPADDETGRAVAWYVHYWSGWVLVVLATVHIAAALWHQFVQRDGLIVRRML